MRLRRIAIPVFCGILLGAAAGFWKLRTRTEGWRRPNILILSFCSLRKAELDPELTPNLHKVFGKAFVFKNAFSRYGWTNPSLYLFDAIKPDFFKDHGYDMIGNEGLGMLFRMPSEFIHYSGAKVAAEQFVHNYRGPLGFFENLLKQPRIKPFFVYAHVKYMHYPYIDTINPDVHWNKFLSPSEKSRVSAALADTSTAKSLPLKLLLTGDSKYAGGKASSRVDFNSLYRYFSSPEVMKAWTSQPEYAGDLEIARKIYRAKLSDWDSFFAGLFDLFGDPDLARNTILIVTGDHGESFMEHGTLGHASNVYDETITFPLAVKFPGQDMPETIDTQFFQGTFIEMVRGLVDGSVTKENFRRKIVALDKNKMIISRNCANTAHSVRMENKWKYIEEAGQEPQLFDLAADPAEKHDVMAAHPDVAAKLKFYLIDHADEFAKVVDISPCRDI